MDLEHKTLKRLLKTKLNAARFLSPLKKYREIHYRKK